MVRSMILGVSALALTSLAGLAVAQDAADPKAVTPAKADGPPAIRPSGNPSRDTLMRMQRVVNIELNETRLEDVMKFVIEQTGIDAEIFWKTDSGDGLDQETLVSLRIKNMTAMEMLDKVLEVTADGQIENAWQMTNRGIMQIGPKSRLNKFKRVEIYDITDLLLILPIHDEAPQVDLDKVLQQSGGGGGGGGSPFSGATNQQKEKLAKDYKEQRAREIIEVVTQLVEPQQWIDGGGDGGTIIYKESFPGQIIVTAADYIHRGLNGYRWWPAARTSPGGTKRYVSLDLDTSKSSLDRPLRTLPVTGVAGGR
ncbi:MAG: hypothetical protein ACKVS8_13205 [Phycisphaerales bacterium]